LIVGISGASGAPYSVRLLEYLAQREGVETHLVISRLGERTIEHETSYEVAAVKRLADFCYDPSDVGATLASGSFRRDGMVVVPCSMKTLSALTHSYAENLIVRAGDVTLKERKPLIVVVRETPLHLGHLRNMVQLTEMGAIVLPPVPSFYHKPTTLENIVDHTVGRILDLLDIEHDLYTPWSGTAPPVYAEE
jgi:4-hydroxy-3-polyprenylbenzoate decarboxylase